MKKVFILLFILVLVMLSVSYAKTSNYKDIEAYKKGQEYYNQAQELQSEGQYDKSYELALLANNELDMVFIEAAKNLMAKLKTKAEADIKKASTVGANTQQASASLNSANASSALIGTFTNDFNKETENYNKSLNDYNNASKLAISSLDTFIKQKTTATQTLIAKAKSKYNGLVSKNFIKKGDANDKSVSAILTNADKALAGQKFDDAQKNANQAITSLNDIEKTIGASVTQSKKIIDQSKQKYNKLVQSSVIKKNDDNDKKVVSLYTEANNLLTQNNFNQVTNKINEANKFMDDIEASHKKAIAEAQEAAIEAEKVTEANIEDQLRKIRDMIRELIANDMLDKNSEEVSNINQVIDRIKSSLAEDNMEGAQDHLNDLVSTVDQVVNETNGQAAGVFPKYYIVREKTPADSLWTIAGYTFIYSNSIHWEVLYNANRNILTDPENPHVIFPNQILEIPSLRGETREGTYSPDIEYEVFE